MAGSEATSDLKWLLVILFVLGVAWLATGGRYNPEATSGPFINPPAPLSDGEGYGPRFGRDGGSAGSVRNYNNSDVSGSSDPSSGTQSSYSRDFYISSGTARSTHLPNNEYVTIRYNGETPVDITGWYLTNARGSKVYLVGSNLVTGNTGVAVIPAVSRLFLNSSYQPKSNLVLERGDEVVLVTGMPPQNLGSVSGFQVNRCSAYLEDDRYTFSPRLWGSCPAPRDWPTVAGVDDKCYRFIETIQACHVPEFRRNADGDETVDGQLVELSSVCRRFIQEQFNYDTCVATFGSQPDFYRPEWRVFLGLRWELWSADREKITFYNRENRVVAELEY